MTIKNTQPLFNRQVLLYPGEDGYIVAEVPSLPGCISQGKTREEALSNIKEAISLYGSPSFTMLKLVKIVKISTHKL